MTDKKTEAGLAHERSLTIGDKLKRDKRAARLEAEGIALGNIGGDKLVADGTRSLVLGTSTWDDDTAHRIITEALDDGTAELNDAGKLWYQFHNERVRRERCAEVQAVIDLVYAAGRKLAVAQADATIMDHEGRELVSKIRDQLWKLHLELKAKVARE